MIAMKSNDINLAAEIGGYFALELPGYGDSFPEEVKLQFGSENEWYSFKIPEYLQLKDLDPITEVAGQVY